MVINEKQAAEMLGLKPETLRWWRCVDRGPAYWRVGRSIRYDSHEVERWRDRRMVRTSEAQR